MRYEQSTYVPCKETSGLFKLNYKLHIAISIPLHVLPCVHSVKAQKFFDCHAFTRVPTLDSADNRLSTYDAQHCLYCIIMSAIRIETTSYGVVSYYRFKKYVCLFVSCKFEVRRKANLAVEMIFHMHTGHFFYAFSFLFAYSV